MKINVLIGEREAHDGDLKIFVFLNVSQLLWRNSAKLKEIKNLNRSSLYFMYFSISSREESNSCMKIPVLFQ